METNREDFGIAVRSAFLKKGVQQRFSLFALTIVSIILLLAETIETKPLNYFRAFIKDTIYRGALVVSTPSKSINNFADFCSIARIPGYTITNKIDAEKIISSKLISSGFRILSVSQRLFKEEIISPDELVYTNDDNSIFQYTQGNDVTVVCFNFSFPNGWNLYNDLKKLGMSVSLFNVNSTTPPIRTEGGIDWYKLISYINISKKSLSSAFW